MGQGISSAGYDQFHLSGQGDDQFRPLTFSDDLGPISRGRALVAQVQQDQPLPYLLTNFYLTLNHARSQSPSNGGLSTIPWTQKKIPPLPLELLNGGKNSIRIDPRLLKDPKSDEDETGVAEQDRTKGRSFQAIADAEYRWLAGFMDRLYSDFQFRADDEATDVFVAGLACWIQFWRQWGDEPPPVPTLPQVKSRLFPKLKSLPQTGDEPPREGDEPQPNPDQTESNSTMYRDASLDSWASISAQSPTPAPGSNPTQGPAPHLPSDPVDSPVFVPDSLEGEEASRKLSGWGSGVFSRVVTRALTLGRDRGLSPSGSLSEDSPAVARGPNWAGGSLQLAILREALTGGDDDSDEHGGGDRQLAAAEVARIVGLAASVSEWRPTAACVILVSMLTRIKSQFDRRGSEQFDKMAELAHSHRFVSWSLGDLLDGCGVAGSSSLVPAGLSNSRCPLYDDLDMFPGMGVGSLTRGRQAPRTHSDSIRELVRKKIEPKKSISSKQWTFQSPVLNLSEIAELALADAMSAQGTRDPCQLCEEADLIFGLELGPGVTAAVISTFLQVLPLDPTDLAELASKFEEMGCREAGFRARVMAVSSPDSAMNLDALVDQVLTETGYGSVPERVARLAGIARGALARTPALDERQGYALALSSAMLKPLRLDPNHTWGFDLARAYFLLWDWETGAGSGFGPLEEDRRRRGLEPDSDFCARVLVHRLGGVLEEGLSDWAKGVDDPRAAVGWGAWTAIGRFLEARNADHPALPTMWTKSVLGTFRTINQEGTGVQRDALAAFDWGLESILRKLPEDGHPVGSLLKALSPLPKRVCSLLLAMAARISNTIYWRWPKRKEATRFVAVLLKYAYDNDLMDGGDIQWAMVIGARHWGWTLPSMEKLEAGCDTLVEAESIYRTAMIGMWESVARSSREGSLIGDSWPVH